MNRRILTLKLIVISLLISSAGRAIPTDGGSSPYAVIIERNPFDLKPPPPPPPTEPPKAPPSNLELTGITTIFGKPEALFNVKEQNGKSSAKKLAVGDPPDDGIELLSINEADGEVRVRNRGVESTLSFKTNAAKPGPAPPPGPVVTHLPIQQPGFVPPQPGNAPNSPAINPTGFTEPAPGEVRTIPSRSIRTPPLTPAQQQQLQQRQILQQQQQAQPAQPLQGQTQQPVDPVAQTLLIEVNRQLNANNPNYPPLPPTAASPFVQ